MVGHPAPGAFGGDPSAGDQEPGVVSAVRSRLEEFLDSFRNFKLERFMSVWGDNPSVFHPFAQASGRLMGEDEVRAGWVTIFEGVRASQPGPPYLDLNARDVDVRPIGSDVAVATFHLDLPDAVGRRSLVFELQRGDWRIVHLPASNLPAGHLARPQTPHTRGWRVPAPNSSADDYQLSWSTTAPESFGGTGARRVSHREDGENIGLEAGALGNPCDDVSLHDMVTRATVLRRLE